MALHCLTWGLCREPDQLKTRTMMINQKILWNHHHRRTLKEPREDVEPHQVSDIPSFESMCLCQKNELKWCLKILFWEYLDWLQAFNALQYYWACLNLRIHKSEFWSPLWKGKGDIVMVGMHCLSGPLCPESSTCNETLYTDKEPVDKNHNFVTAQW